MVSDVYSTVFPIAHLDGPTFFAVVQDLSEGDFGRLAQVSKACREAISAKQLWANLHEREGIPQVEELNGEVRNYRRDYFTLLPITSGRKIIEETLPLKMVGSIPKIRREVFARLYDLDPFQPERFIGQNYIFVVVPGLVQAKNGQVMQFALEQLRNLRYDLSQVRSAPVFNQHSLEAVFQQCARGSDKTSVFLMRKQVVDQSRNKTFEDQVHLVGEHQMQVTDMKTRGLSHGIQILLTGTCSDARTPRLTYARCSDPVVINGRRYQSAIGGFAPGAGVGVGHVYDHDGIGVVPGVPAEVLPATLP